MKIEVDHNIEQVRAAFRKAPLVMLKRADQSLAKSRERIVRGAKRNTAKAESTLTNSIFGKRVTIGEHFIGVGAAHGRAVEEGTGPGGSPPIQSLLDWMRVKGIRGVDEDDTINIAFLIRKKIAFTGTPAQPYLRPAYRSERPKLIRDYLNAVTGGARELGFNVR